MRTVSLLLTWLAVFVLQTLANNDAIRYELLLMYKYYKLEVDLGTTPRRIGYKLPANLDFRGFVITRIPRADPHWPPGSYNLAAAATKNPSIATAEALIPDPSRLGNAAKINVAGLSPRWDSEYAQAEFLDKEGHSSSPPGWPDVFKSMMADLRASIQAKRDARAPTGAVGDTHTIVAEMNDVVDKITKQRAQAVDTSIRNYFQAQPGSVFNGHSSIFRNNPSTGALDADDTAAAMRADQPGGNPGLYDQSRDSWNGKPVEDIKTDMKNWTSKFGRDSSTEKFSNADKVHMNVIRAMQNIRSQVVKMKNGLAAGTWPKCK